LSCYLDSDSSELTASAKHCWALLKNDFFKLPNVREAQRSFCTTKNNICKKSEEDKKLASSKEEQSDQSRMVRRNRSFIEMQKLVTKTVFVFKHVL
jgi:hypothetical protein